MDYVVLRSKIFVYKISAVSIIGVYSADTSGSQENVIGLFRFKKIKGGPLIEQI